MESSDTDFKEPLLESLCRMKILLKQMDDASYSEHEVSAANPVLVDLKTLEDIRNVVSHQATALSMAFSRPPYPDKNSTTLMSTKLDASILRMVSHYFSIPNKAGKALKAVYKSCIVGILDNVVCFLNALIADENKETKLKLIGCIWGCCNDIIDTVPPSNVQAVVNIIMAERMLVDDALVELQEMLNSGQIDDDVDMHEFDRESALKCLGLVKASRACLKRIASVLKNRVDQESTSIVNESDKLGDYAKNVSSLVDDIIASVYPPVRKSVILGNAHSLACLLLDIVNMSNFPNILTEEDASWTNFLKGAVEHNLSLIADYSGN